MDIDITAYRVALVVPCYNEELTIAKDALNNRSPNGVAVGQL
jgi:hypothetical protein